MNDDDLPVVAAIVHTGHGSADGLLADFARHMHGLGWRVYGVVQDDTVLYENNTCARQMVLVDIDNGSRFPISQNLGSGSVSCCIDPGGVAEASIALRRGLVEGADLVVANRFGELEANGGGFAAEMLALMAGGVPLLTVVADKYLDAWRRFTGGIAEELPPQGAALQAWFANPSINKRNTA